MERNLTDNERAAILEICRSNVFLTKYMNLCVIIAPLLTIALFTKLHFTFNQSYLFIAIGVVLAVVAFIAIRNAQIEMKSILNHTAVCSERVVMNKVTETGWARGLNHSTKVKHDYVLVNDNGCTVKASYLGRDFDYLGINDQVLLIRCGKNILKKDVYICFSMDCINRESRRAMI